MPWPPLATLWWARLGAHGSRHPGGANVATADGSARFLSRALPQLGLLARSTRNGNDAAPAE